MTRSCDDFRALARREADDDLPAREFAALDDHLGRCDPCTAWRRRADPLALFQALAEDREDGPGWAGLWEGVRAGVQEGGRLDLREGLGLLRPVYRVALAASLVVAVGVVALLGRGAAPAPRALGDPFAGVAAALPSAGPGVATVESIDSPGARVYEMSVLREGAATSQLVMIFDEGIDL